MFFATSTNYIDRQALSILAPQLASEDDPLGRREVRLHRDGVSGGVRAVGLAVADGLIDRFGTWIGFAVAIGIWSVAGMAHAAARTALEFAVARFALGLGEAGSFPAAVKTTAEWFSRRERALATGIFNSGSNVGAIVAPALVPVIVVAVG